MCFHFFCGAYIQNTPGKSLIFAEENLEILIEYE